MALDAAQRTQIVDLIKAGKGRNQIAKIMQVSTAMVSKVARENDLYFDRTATEQATRARQADIQAMRSELELKYLEDAENIRQRIWLPAEYVQYVGKDGVRVVDRPPEPRAADMLNYVRASTLMSDKSLALAQANSEEGLEAAKSMLGNLLGALKESMAEPTEPEPDAEPDAD